MAGLPKNRPRRPEASPSARLRRIGDAHVLSRVLPVAMLGLALVAVPILIFEPEGLPRLRALEHEMAEVDAENAELKRDIAHLRVDVKQLRDDPRAVERIARDQLGLVRKSEVCFQFGKGK